MNKLEIKAIAKINLGLSVVSKRNDNYHNLETIFYPITDLFDVLTFEKSSSFQFKTNNSLIPTDDSNLILRAKSILEKITNSKISVKIFHQKNIPIGAGLAGGSSDAASTLQTLNDMFILGLDYKTLMNLALELGSDVPYFLRPGLAYGKGRGENLEYRNFKFKYPILLVNPDIHVSTKEAFQNITPEKPLIDYQTILENIDNFEFLNNYLRNDFEKTIFKKHPEIESVKKLMIENNALLSLMSGTGSTVFGIFEKIEDAQLVFDMFPASYFKFISFP